LGGVSAERFLLCQPQGGLNDTLCQIGRACLYAERFDRTVVVDTNHARKPYFRDDLSNYFVSRDRRLLLSPTEAPGLLDEPDVFPVFLKGRLRDYVTCYDRTVSNFVDAENGEAPTFDFEQDYPQRLIVHEACGGGDLSLAALARLRLRDPLREELVRRRALAGPRYSAVHVRYTDYQAGYESLTAQQIAPVDPLFVATDNPGVVAHFQALIGADRVLSFASLPHLDGSPFHQPREQDDHAERNRDAILDLLMLTLATRFYILPLKPNANDAEYSGFSMLAANLRENPEPLAGLIAAPEPATAPNAPKTYSFGFRLKVPWTG
jgi:hypothetical protein